jgi:hypothetical protein
MDRLEKLLSIASNPFIQSGTIAHCLAQKVDPIYGQIQEMLQRKNGFCAFESALVVFPATDSTSLPGLDSWNNLNGWRRWYHECVPNEVVFFAEDLFGLQFGSHKSEIIRFDPEIGELMYYASSLEQWAENLLLNYAEDTGWPIAHDWQTANGPILPSQRLLPKQPFVLGGDYEPQNLRLVDRRNSMEKWGSLYQQIRSVPDGHEVTVSGWLD